jgi:hypothetical protein
LAARQTKLSSGDGPANGSVDGRVAVDPGHSSSRLRRDSGGNMQSAPASAVGDAPDQPLTLGVRRRPSPLAAWSVFGRRQTV